MKEFVVVARLFQINAPTSWGLAKGKKYKMVRTVLLGWPGLIGKCYLFYSS